MDTIGDPTSEASGWARPGALLAWVAVLYGLVMAPIGFAAVVESVRHPGVLIGWAVFGFVFGAPLTLIASAAAISRERWLVGRVLAGRLIWTGNALGGLVIAHWLPMLSWSPVAMYVAMSTSGSTSDDHLASALYGMVAWVVVAAGIGLLGWTRWTFRRRVGRPLKALMEEWPQWVPTAAVFGLLAAPVSAVVVVALAESGPSFADTLPVLAILFAVGLLSALGGAWGVATSDVERARRGERSAPFADGVLRASAACLTAQWSATLAMACVVDWGAAVGPRFLLQVVSISIVVAAVGVLGGTDTFHRRLTA